MIDEDLKRQARQADLGAYLISRGEPLKLTGDGRYRHKEHDSLVITKNAYFWNSKQEHGNAIDFLRNYYDMTFPEAVTALTKQSGFSTSHTNHLLAPAEKVQALFDFDSVQTERNMHRVIAYLTKSRMIRDDIVQDLIHNQNLYQETKTNNAIFPIRNENNRIVGAELVGTLSDIYYKEIKKDTEYGYGFSLRTDDKPMEKALFFESAIDLLSFVQLQKRSQNISLDGCLLVSMMALKPCILDHMIKAFGGETPLTPVLCVDNDEAGHNFIQKVKTDHPDAQVLLPKEGFKDWNDQLRGKRMALEKTEPKTPETLAAQKKKDRGDR